MKYTCERCGYETNELHNLKRNLTRKITCDTINSNISIDDIFKKYNKEKKITCDGCDKLYSSRQGLFIHKKNSKCSNKNNSITSTKKDIYDIVKNEIGKIKQYPTIQNITNNIQQNNNNITIQLKSFGFENIKHLESDKEYMTKCLLNKDVMRLIENIHCDVEHPENVNVKIKSTKKELMETYIDGRWIISDQEETLDELLNKGYRILNFFRHRNKDHILKECEDDEGELYEMQDWLEDLYSNTKMRKPLKRKMLILFMNNKTLFLQKEENIIISNKEEKNIPIKNIVFPNELVDNKSNENIIIQDEEDNDDDSVISDRSYEPEEMSPEEAAKYTQSVWDPTKYLKNTK